MTVTYARKFCFRKPFSLNCRFVLCTNYSIRCELSGLYNQQLYFTWLCVHFSRIKEHDELREKEMEQDKNEGEELRKLAQLHRWEEEKLEEMRRKEKAAVMQSHKDHMNNKWVLILFSSR